MILWIILLILLLGGGGWGYSRYGAMGASPVGFALVVLLLLYVTGYIGRGA